MKKSLIFLYGLLVLLFIGASLYGMNSEYAGEKRLWHLTRQYGTIVKNHKGTPKASYDALLARFENFIRRHPDLKATSVAYIMRARLFTIQEEHIAAVNEINRGYARFKDNEPIAIQFLLELAQMYAIQENSQGVNSTYEKIITDYPLTKYGIQGPLILAKYFVQKRDAAKAKSAYLKAIDHYKNLIKTHPDSGVEFQARVLLGESYNSLEDWEKALKIYSETLLKFANLEFWNRSSFLHITQSINTFAILRMGQFDRAIEIYQSFLDKYPEHPFTADLTRMIGKIQQMKLDHQKQLELKAAESAPAVNQPTATP